MVVRVDERGRVVVPADVRDRLGIKDGSVVILTVEGDHVTLISAAGARRRARERVRSYVAPGLDLCEELMAERKAEARWG
jgi:AbrB family looped-hinge helix DNA binding protein